MKTYTYTPQGTCARNIEFTIDDQGRVADISFTGGCNGNLKGLSRLAIGLTPAQIVERLEGLTCGMKSTSCPDQLAQALKEI